jgi:sulfur carrier protein
MRLSVNGEPHELPGHGVTVTDLLAILAPGVARGLAVAVNGAVVPRGEWSTTVLKSSDAVEVLTAAQGG